jgi:hypothetical protein
LPSRPQYWRATPTEFTAFLAKPVSSGGCRTVLHLRLDHRRRDRRCAAHWRLWIREGIVLGTLTFSIVNQGIFYTGFDANWASLIIGVLLLLAVIINNTFRNMALTYAPRVKTRA